MSSKETITESTLYRVSDAIALQRCRAKYIPQDDGTLRLAMVQEFSFPIFRGDGFEEVGTRKNEHLFASGEQMNRVREEYARRSERRAKVAVLDLILCNPELDTFCTFTYAPDKAERTSYEDVYKKLSIWCSNSVQRRGLIYVAVPEYHKDGEAIHFHMVANRSALDLHFQHWKIKHTNGSPIYNIKDWAHGFSTAVEINAGKKDRDAVAKYIFKYMGKQSGQKIGGRYYLHGGKLRKPVYVLAETPEIFFDGEEPKYHRELEIVDGAKYREWSFV